jgi:hypothetical protein
VGLEAEGEDGDEYEEDGGEGDDPRPGGRVRLVKQRPDLWLRPLPARRLTCMVTRRIIYTLYVLNGLGLLFDLELRIELLTSS